MNILVIGGGRDNIGLAVAKKFKESNGGDNRIVGVDIKWEKDIIMSDVYNKIYRCNITNELQVCDLFDRIESDFFIPDVVVNSAGINILGKIENYELGNFFDTMGVNLVSQFLLVKEMVKRYEGNGREKTFLAVTSDTGTFLAKSSSFAYGASKAGANAFLQAIARDLDKYYTDKWNILAFAAGMVEGTPMDKRTITDLCNQRGIDEPTVRAMLVNNIPKHRGLSLSEAAEWIYFLCTKGQYASGNIMRVDNFQQQG